MITGHVFIATSLDGFIARKNGDIGWLLEHNSSAEDHGYDEFIKDIDAIVMGRGTFEAMRDMKPWFYSRPVLVLSATLANQEAPADLQDKVRFTAISPQDAMAMLEAEGCRRIYVDGGQVIQSFLSHGLICDMVVTRVPILLGTGRELFGELPGDIRLEHGGTRAFPSGLVQSTYNVLP